MQQEIREARSALSECAGNMRELSAMVHISQEYNEKRLEKLERIGMRLLIGVLLLSGGGAITGQIMAKLLGN